MDVLLTALLVFLALATLMGVIAVLAVVLGTRALRKRNRVSPAVASPAPTSWLGAPTTAARLHRRLRDAVTVAQAAAAAAETNPQLSEIAEGVEAEAVALDGHVVITARMPAKARRPHQVALADQVRRIEGLASQVSVASAQARAPRVAAGQPGALDELATQLDALEEARAEVIQVESDAGIHRVSPYAVPERPAEDRTRPGA